MNTAVKSSQTTDKRQQILDVAHSIILGKGFTAVGLNEILKAAQVPKGSFYHYFQSKEQFGNALLENYFEQYTIKLDAMLSDDGTPAVDRLVNYFDNWLSTQCNDTTRDKCMVVKLSGEVTDLSETMRLTLKKGTEAVITRLAQCVEEAIAGQQLNTDKDAYAFAAEIYYMWLGASLITKVRNDEQALHTAMQFLRQQLNLKH